MMKDETRARETITESDLEQGYGRRTITGANCETYVRDGVQCYAADAEALGLHRWPRELPAARGIGNGQPFDLSLVHDEAGFAVYDQRDGASTLTVYR